MRNSSKLTGVLGLGTMLTLFAIWSAQAQTVLGTVAMPGELEVGGSTSLTMDTARAVIGSKATGRDMPSIDAPIIARHLPATLSGWRIDGEIGSLQWPVYIAAGEAPTLTRFRLSYRSAAAVLPDTSTLTLSINDVVVGRSSIASPARVVPIDFDIPADALRAGFNAVRVAVEQRHGVDCSLDATYELTTEIIPDASGFLAGHHAPPNVLTLNDLAALRLRGDGALPIEVLVSQRMKPIRVEQVLRATQAVALAAHSQMPVVNFASEQMSDAGVRLVIGTSADLSGVLPSEPAVPGLAFVPGDNGRAPMLVIGGATEADVEVSLTQLMALARADATGTPSGLRSLANVAGFKVSGGERVRLVDFGITDTEFSGRSFRQSLSVKMPADFMAADSGKLTIDLAGAYAAGLKSDAQLRVEINGQNSASVNLAKASGDVFHHNEILVPLGQLRPGPNQIAITAQLATKADDACDGVATLDRETKRFLLLANTEIRFPHFARVARSPDLNPMSAGAFPYAGSANPRLVVPSPNRQSLSASVTLATRMSVAAQAIIPFSFAVTANNTRTHTLIVSTAQSLDPRLMDRIGLDPAAVRQAWDDGGSRNVPVSMSERIVQRVAASDDIVDRWSDMVSQNTVWGAIRSTTVSAVRQGADSVADMIRRPTALSNPVAPNSALILAQGFAVNDVDDVITIVTAPTSIALAQGVEQLSAPAHWAALRGRLSAMDVDGNVLNAVDAAHPRYIATQPASLGNARLVAAGWFSLNPVAYVVFVLILAGALAATTASLVRNVGRRN